MKVSYLAALILLVAAEYVYCRNITVHAHPDSQIEKLVAEQAGQNRDSKGEAPNETSDTPQNVNQGESESGSEESQDGGQKKSPDSNSGGTQEENTEKPQDAASEESKDETEGEPENGDQGESQDAPSEGSNNGVRETERNPEDGASAELQSGYRRRKKCEKSENSVQKGQQRGPSRIGGNDAGGESQNDAPGMSETNVQEKPQANSSEGIESSEGSESSEGCENNAADRSAVLKESENGYQGESGKVTPQQRSRGTPLSIRLWTRICSRLSIRTMLKREQYDSPAEYQRILDNGAQRGLQTETQERQQNCRTCGVLQVCRRIQQARQDVRREFQRSGREPFQFPRQNEMQSLKQGELGNQEGDQQSPSSGTLDAQ